MSQIYKGCEHKLPGFMKDKNGKILAITFCEVVHMPKECVGVIRDYYHESRFVPPHKSIYDNPHAHTMKFLKKLRNAKGF